MTTLLERLDAGPVICAEGYLFELEKRGYLDPTAFVPEVLLEHPEVVAELHRDFARAGSDVIEAFTYYAHREKLRQIGRDEDLVELMNQTALGLARDVADDFGALLAGNICNTNVFGEGEAARNRIAAMFDEQIGWAVDAGADFVIGETFVWCGEAVLAAERIKEAGATAVVTVAILKDGRTREGWTAVEAARRVAAAGADVVGLNCLRGPATMLPLLREVRAAVECHLAALPVPYRTDDAHVTFHAFHDGDAPQGNPFPSALDPFTCTRYDMARFAIEARDLGVHYLGVCCGAGPHHIRAIAEALGRTPPASRFSFDPQAARSNPDLRGEMARV